MALQAGKLEPSEDDEESTKKGLELVVNIDADAPKKSVSDAEKPDEDVAKPDSSSVALADEENRVLKTVEEFCHLHREMHDVRENLIALGAPFQTVGVLVELGFNSRHEEQEKLIRSCLESQMINGVVDPLTEEKFRQQLLQMTELERDMAHARKVARESGMLIPALNSLTNMIRQNPGDGGELVINTFVAYALAAGVKLEMFQEILDSSKKKKESVLPVIDMDTPDPRVASRKAMIRDLFLSTCITVFIMYLIV